MKCLKCLKDKAYGLSQIAPDLGKVRTAVSGKAATQAEQLRAFEVREGGLRRRAVRTVAVTAALRTAFLRIAALRGNTVRAGLCLVLSAALVMLVAVLFAGCSGGSGPTALPSEGVVGLGAGVTEAETTAVAPVFDEDLDLSRRMHSTDADIPTWAEIHGLAEKFKALLATPEGIALTADTINPESFFKLNTDLGEIGGLHIRVFEYSTMLETKLDDNGNRVRHPDWIFIQVIDGGKASVIDVTGGMQGAKLNSVHAVKNGFAVLFGNDRSLSTVYLSTWLADGTGVVCTPAVIKGDAAGYTFGKLGEEYITVPDKYIAEITVPDDAFTYADEDGGSLVIGDKLKLTFDGAETYAASLIAT